MLMRRYYAATPISNTSRLRRPDALAGLAADVVRHRAEGRHRRARSCRRYLQQISAASGVNAAP